jgi:serine/threonine-protein kinase RsbW
MVCFKDIFFLCRQDNANMKAPTTLKIPADLNELAAAREFMRETATSLGVDPATISDMVLAANEAITNIIVHGYENQPGMIEIEVKREIHTLIVCLRDQAPLFDPLTAPMPDLTLPLEQRPFGGMGIYMTQQLMDEVLYRITPQGDNELTLIKQIKGENK